jgi:putative hydrolase of the HAD superfamily
MSAPSPLLDIVLFDVDDTLYSTTEFARRARRWAVRAMIDKGLEAEEEEVYQELKEVVAEFSSNYENHLDRLIDRLGSERLGDVKPAVIVAAGVIAYHKTKQSEMVALDDVRAVLDALQGGEVRCGVVTAGLSVKQAEKLIRLRVLPYFDPRAIFFSEQMGISKPNPKIYRKACAALGVEPSRALYVGDRPSHDVVPARAVGLKTVLYRGAGGKYASEPPTVPPDHEVEDLRELLPILRTTYGLPV